MDERYRPIYQDLYAARTEQISSERLQSIYAEAVIPFSASVIRYAIGRSEREAMRSLREDAKALLAVNFEDLVVYPLLSSGEVDRSRLNADVTSDIRMLVSAASNEMDVEFADRHEITARNVIDALSKNWANLLLRVTRCGSDGTWTSKTIVALPPASSPV